MSWRGSLRVRLTVAFGAMFFAATAAVLAVTVILVQNSMEYSFQIAFLYGPDDGSKAIIMASMWRNLLFKGGVAAMATQHHGAPWSHPLTRRVLRAGRDGSIAHPGGEWGGDP